MLARSPAATLSWHRRLRFKRFHKTWRPFQNLFRCQILPHSWLATMRSGYNINQIGNKRNQLTKPSHQDDSQRITQVNLLHSAVNPVFSPTGLKDREERLQACAKAETLQANPHTHPPCVFALHRNLRAFDLRPPNQVTPDFTTRPRPCARADLRRALTLARVARVAGSVTRRSWSV